MSWKETKSWYSTSDVAKILGRSDRFVRDRVKSGELDASEHKGQKRTSYKISAEALAAYALQSQTKQKSVLAAALDGVEEDYLREVESAVRNQLRKRMGAEYEIVPRGEPMKMPVLLLEQRHYPDFEITEELFAKIAKNPMKFNSTVLNKKTKEAEGHLSLEITHAGFFDDIVAGRVNEEFQPPWEPNSGQTPVLYIDSFILEDPMWAPFLYRNLAKQMKDFEKKYAVDLHACFAIASAPNVERLMLKYGFEQVGLYEQKYPVMVNKDIKAGTLGRYLR